MIWLVIFLWVMNLVTILTTLAQAGVLHEDARTIRELREEVRRLTPPDDPEWIVPDYPDLPPGY